MVTTHTQWYWESGNIWFLLRIWFLYLYLHSAHKYSSIKYAVLNSYHWYHLLIQKKPILAKQREKKNRSRIILQRFASVYAICRDIFFSSVSFSSRRTFQASLCGAECLIIFLYFLVRNWNGLLNEQKKRKRAHKIIQKE